MQPDQVGFFAEFIKKEIGIVFSDSNYFQLINRRVEVSKTMGFESTDELYAKAKAGIHDDL